MRHLLLALSILLAGSGPAAAQLSIGVGLPGVRIGIDLPLFPELVRVPNLPVYVAPRLQLNYFFYDGMYWVLLGDDWYASTWYNGPWALVAPDAVPLFILRIPVRYYRSPPAYFHGWRPEAPPRWGEHWGSDWAHEHAGWDHWDPRAQPAPRPAPLPTYQRRYPGDRYPRPDQQPDIQNRHHHPQPVDPVVRRHFEQQVGPRPAPGAHPGQGAPQPPGHARPKPADKDRAKEDERARSADRP